MNQNYSVSADNMATGSRRHAVERRKNQEVEDSKIMVDQQSTASWRKTSYCQRTDPVDTGYRSMWRMLQGFPYSAGCDVCDWFRDL